MRHDLLPASEAVRILASKYTVTVRARKFHELILDGVVPAEKVNGRYYISRDKIGEIVKTLGFKPLSKQAA